MAVAFVCIFGENTLVCVSSPVVEKYTDKSCIIRYAIQNIY